MECPTGEIVDYKGRTWPSLQTYCYQSGAGLQTESPNEWDARLAELQKESSESKRRMTARAK